VWKALSGKSYRIKTNGGIPSSAPKYIHVSRIGHLWAAEKGAHGRKEKQSRLKTR
jgi:hypothetical protein